MYINPKRQPLDIESIALELFDYRIFFRHGRFLLGLSPEQD